MKYTWNQFEEDVEGILKWMSSHEGKFDKIYGIPKGGLPLAVKLCNMVEGIPLILDRDKVDERTLVVDDISDTGKTLEEFKKLDCLIVALFIHKNTTVLPNFYLREKKDEWIDFPWDNSGKKYRDGTHL